MKKHTATVLLAMLAAQVSVPATATELVVIVHPKNRATRMFGEQASQFFLGKSSLFTPVEYGDSNALRAEFAQKVLGKDTAQVKAIWSKLVFTGKAVPPREYATAADVKRAVAADVSAIGYIDRNSVDDSVKVILSIP
ncbi:MAG: hypothetical protein V4724_29245 [Pseudomonadota bacterium]